MCPFACVPLQRPRLVAELVFVGRRAVSSRSDDPAALSRHASGFQKWKARHATDIHRLEAELAAGFDDHAVCPPAVLSEVAGSCCGPCHSSPCIQQMRLDSRKCRMQSPDVAAPLSRPLERLSETTCTMQSRLLLAP